MQAAAYPVDEGGAFTGFVNGRTTYDFLHDVDDKLPTDLEMGQWIPR